MMATRRLHGPALALLAVSSSLAGASPLAAQAGRAAGTGGGEAPVEMKPVFGPMRDDRGTATRPYDLKKVHLRLEVDLAAKRFAGSVINHVVALNGATASLWFDAENLAIESVAVDGTAVPFRHEASRLHVTLLAPAAAGQALAVEVRYSGQDPRRGLWFIQPTPENPDRLPECWSQGQAEDNRHWIPTWDYPTDRATYEGEFTVKDGLTVVSNGRLNGRRPAGEGRSTWHFSLDFAFPTYLISLCVGDYERYADDWRGIPVEYYVQRGVGEAKARRSFGQTPDMMEFFSTRIGVPYMYPKYSQVAVQDFIVGGMENISATTQTDGTLHDEREHLDRESQGLVAHELAHQWWGDYLTCRTWRHLWLNEGFAQYFDALYQEKVSGRDAFALQVRGSQQSAIGADARAPRPLVESFFNRQPRGDGHNNVYVRGASVLHMIRHLLGDEGWWKAMNHWCTKHAGDLVDSTDFEIAIEEATGQNLHWLFEQFVYLGGHPKFEVAQSWDEEKKEVVLDVKQVQDTSGMVAVFRWPCPIEVVCGDARTRHVVELNAREQQIRLPAPVPPTMVAFDQGSTLLKEVAFRKSVAELAFIAAGGDSDAVARLAAIDQLAAAVESDREAARTVLTAVLRGNDWRDLRSAAASALAKVGGPAAIAALQAGVADRESRVRRACVAGLAALEKEMGDARDAVAGALTEALRSDLSYQVQAAACEALTKLGGDAALFALRAATDYPSPSDRVGTAALRARLGLEDAMAVDEVFALARAAPGAPRRGLGLQSLGAIPAELLGQRRDEAIALLMDAVKVGGDGQRAAVGALGELKALEAEAMLKELSAKSDASRGLRFVLGGALRQIEAARQAASAPAGVFAGASAGAPAEAPTTEQLAETIRRIETQLAELKARLDAATSRPAQGSLPNAGPGNR
jgi:aminopeptidase N